MIFSKEEFLACPNQRMFYPFGPPTEAQYEQVKQLFMGGGVGKQIRPWLVVDLPSKQPADATLFGWEIETGYNSNAAFNAVMNYLWHNTDYTTVDCEGCGDRPVEISFPPIPMDDHQQIIDFFNWQNTTAAVRNHVALNYPLYGINSRGGAIGTHVNISTPRMRANQAAELASNTSDLRMGITQVSNVIRAQFRQLSEVERFALYGRQPYSSDALPYARGYDTPATARYEFKMFHSTAHVGQFTNYMKVAVRLAELVDLDGVVPNGLTLFDFLTQDLPDRTVIHPENTAQYSQTLREAVVAGLNNPELRSAAA